MTYAILTTDGAILGSFHSTKEAAIAAAKAMAHRELRVIGYGRAGEVQSIDEVGK